MCWTHENVKLSILSVSLIDIRNKNFGCQYPLSNSPFNSFLKLISHFKSLKLAQGEKLLSINRFMCVLDHGWNKEYHGQEFEVNLLNMLVHN